jgi:hypothetical protein
VTGAAKARIRKQDETNGREMNKSRGRRCPAEHSHGPGRQREADNKDNKIYRQQLGVQHSSWVQRSTSTWLCPALRVASATPRPTAAGVQARRTSAKVPTINGWRHNNKPPAHEADRSREQVAAHAHRQQTTARHWNKEMTKPRRH